MGGYGHWLCLEQVAVLRHAENLAAAEQRRLLRAAGVGARGARIVWLTRALAAAGASVTRLLTSPRPAEVPARVGTVPQPAEGVLLD